jgi:hypothetical protein
MSLRRALCVVASLLPAAVAPAAAQFAPGPPPQQQQQTPPPCIQEFLRLRDDASKKAGLIRAASEHKATPKEACGLFNTFVAAEVKMIKYAETNATWCGIPPQILPELKKSHAQAMQIRNKVCSVAAAGTGPQMAPRAPNLSDTLGGPIPDPNNIKTGRGTFDTLTGSPLGSK